MRIRKSSFNVGDAAGAEVAGSFSEEGGFSDDGALVKERRGECLAGTWGRLRFFDDFFSFF